MRPAPVRSGGCRADTHKDRRGAGTWRARRDSNSRPLGPQPNALSTELRAHATLRRGRVAEREGFEPSEQVTPLNGLANRRTRPLCDLSVAQRWPCYHGLSAAPAGRMLTGRPTSTEARTMPDSLPPTTRER